MNGVSADPNKLKVFRSDPFDFHSLTDALRGCSGLFYSFEPPLDQTNYDVSTIFSVFPSVSQQHNIIKLENSFLYFHTKKIGTRLN